MGEHWLVSLTLSARTAPQLLSTETSAPLWRTPHREAQTRPLATPTLTAHPGPAIPLVSASGPPCHSRPSALIGKGARHSQGGSAGARSRPFGTTCCPEWETRQASQRAPSLGCRFGPPAAAPPRSPAARASVTRPYTAAAAHRASARRAPGLAGPRQPLRTPSGSGSTASPRRGPLLQRDPAPLTWLTVLRRPASATVSRRGVCPRAAARPDGGRADAARQPG